MFLPAAFLISPRLITDLFAGSFCTERSVRKLFSELSLFSEPYRFSEAGRLSAMGALPETGFLSVTSFLSETTDSVST